MRTNINLLCLPPSVPADSYTLWIPWFAHRHAAQWTANGKPLVCNPFFCDFFLFFLNLWKNDFCRMRTKSHLFVHHYHRSYWKATRAQIVPGQSCLMRCDPWSLKNMKKFDIHLDPSLCLCSCFRESTATPLITGEETVSLTSLMWKHRKTHWVGKIYPHSPCRDWYQCSLCRHS